ncbi:MAG: DUF1997 domain-containing protein [Synechococcales bacterium]|nr:DUF1997 domain-containing protein [Synechococcales bacterium]
MQANSANHHLYGTSGKLLHITSDAASSARMADDHGSDEPLATAEPSQFRGQFASCMEMYADSATVKQYLDSHHEWFHRCAHPMAAEPLGDNGYALIIGRFGSFGYEVEPKIGLDLLPQDEGVYRICTIPIPGYEPPGYDVDFRASLQLVDAESGNEATCGASAVTHVEWELDLNVLIHFPRFIHALPKSLVQTTGDRLLNQIVRQVSRRLTRKVQEDFHRQMGIPFPKPRKKAWR